VHELWERVKEEWDRISVKACQELIESLPRRINAVIKAKEVIQTTNYMYIVKIIEGKKTVPMIG
jgi:hypothetical protein